jgi:predicted RNase H-like HicB family nuclease
MNAHSSSSIYIGVVQQEGDSAYGIWFPDLAGCFSAADTLEELRGNAIEAVALYLEDQESHPAARNIEDIRRDTDVASDLSAGAFLYGVPVVKFTGRTVKANITLDAGLLQAVDAEAKIRGLTRSAFITDIARREIAG